MPGRSWPGSPALSPSWPILKPIWRYGQSPVDGRVEAAEATDFQKSTVSRRRGVLAVSPSSSVIGAVNGRV